MGQVAIVGGGIAGLVAAAELARRGLQPRLFESAPELGGRARTRSVDGFHLNQGPHALYLGGAFNRVLTNFGIKAPGGSPRLRDGLALWGDEIHKLPLGRAASSNAPPLSTSDAGCLAETFARIGSGSYDGKGTPLRSFTATLPSAVQTVIEAFARLSTYAHAPDDMDCKAALDQIRLSFGGVTYVDGGWQTLIGGLAAAATDAGAVLQHGNPLVAIRRQRQSWTIELAGGNTETFDSVILAVPPAVARELASSSAHVAAAAGSTKPLRAMCLDLGLTTVGSGAEFALGMDAPTYLSLHSAVAALAPPGGGLLHLSRYLAPGEAPEAAHFDELEQMADRLQPGWRDRIAQRQRLVGLQIVHDFPRWQSGGRRAPVLVPDAPGLFLAGDWVGDEGMLSDAAAASAGVAAREATAFLAGVRP
jgi:phytoene dehydrogenase-like protein